MVETAVCSRLNNVEICPHNRSWNDYFILNKNNWTLSYQKLYVLVDKFGMAVSDMTL